MSVYTVFLILHVFSLAAGTSTKATYVTDAEKEVSASAGDGLAALHQLERDMIANTQAPNSKPAPSTQRLCSSKPGYTEAQCNFLGCCTFQNGECVGDGTSRCPTFELFQTLASGFAICERAWSQEECLSFGCCSYEAGAGGCKSAVGLAACKSSIPVLNAVPGVPDPCGPASPSNRTTFQESTTLKPLSSIFTTTPKPPTPTTTSDTTTTKNASDTTTTSTPCHHKDKSTTAVPGQEKPAPATGKPTPATGKPDRPWHVRGVPPEKPEGGPVPEVPGQKLDRLWRPVETIPEVPQQKLDRLRRPVETIPEVPLYRIPEAPPLAPCLKSASSTTATTTKSTSSTSPGELLSPHSDISGLPFAPKKAEEAPQKAEQGRSGQAPQPWPPQQSPTKIAIR